jgi:hypothetical protein
METAPEAVTLGPAILVLITMIGTLVLLRFHARNAKGRSGMNRAAGEQGQDFYQRLIALELLSMREHFEAEERSERDRSETTSIDLTAGSSAADEAVTIDLTAESAESDEQRRESAQSETKAPGSST